MHRTDPGTGQHRDGGLGYHRHVNRNPVSPVDALRLQNIGKFADFFMQFGIGNLAMLFGVVRLPDDRDLVTTGRKMPIQTVVGDIELAAGKPVDVQILFVETPVAYRIPGFEPGQIVFRLLRPESLGILDRLAIHLFILGRVDIRLCGKLFGNWIDFAF